MKQNLIVDYLSCILFRGLSFFTRFMPLGFSLFLGRRLGDLIYVFDRRHRAVVYANIRKSVADKLDCPSCARITRKAYQSFGQNIVEITFIPRINKQYLEKYIHIENKNNIEDAFKRGKGVIFLIVHEGNWELSNIICANLGFPFVLFVRDQGFPRLNALLNSYRLKQEAMIIHRDGGIRQLIETLKKNQAVGMTMDQGGKKGEIVNFFGRQASMSSGAVKLALKYDCSIIPVFYTRIRGPYIKVILDSVYTVTRSADFENDLKENLQRLTGIYERYIRQYPQEYLWTYKIWKYGKERDVLILSDGKAGHLRQSEGVAELITRQLSGRGIKTNLSVKQVEFRSFAFRFMFSLAVMFSGRYQCQSCLRCLRLALAGTNWQELMALRPDIIISAGSSLSAVNYLLAKENQAKSVVLMRPANLSLKKFDLVIMPEHDWQKGVSLGNAVITAGALNVVNADYLSSKSEIIRRSGLLNGPVSGDCIGLLIGGSSKKFSIGAPDIMELSGQIKESAEELGADILVSTSRRTSSAAEQAVKNEFTAYSRCKLLVIANENNNPDAAGGILGLSRIIVCSPESISMISESVSAGRYVIVYKAGGLSRKHRRFLKNYQEKGYIYLHEMKDLAGIIRKVWVDKPKINVPEDNLKVIAGLNKII